MKKTLALAGVVALALLASGCLSPERLCALGAQAQKAIDEGRGGLNERAVAEGYRATCRVLGYPY
jgi:hypothetical protein